MKQKMKLVDVLVVLVLLLIGATAPLARNLPSVERWSLSIFCGVMVIVVLIVVSRRGKTNSKDDGYKNGGLGGIGAGAPQPGGFILDPTSKPSKRPGTIT